jgi:hypothetical protein
MHIRAVLGGAAVLVSTIAMCACSDAKLETGGGLASAPLTGGSGVVTAQQSVLAAPEPSRAGMLLSRLRNRHRIVSATRAQLAADAHDEHDVDDDARTSVLKQSELGLHKVGTSFRPVAKDSLPSTAEVEISLPARSAQPFRLESRETGVALDVTMQQVREVQGELAEGYVVYPEAGPQGGTLLQRAVPEGTEDFLTFDSAPTRSEVVYEIKLSSQTAGLRLVDNTLEAVTVDGDPRLRMAAPYVVSADGSRIEAQLAVNGCAVDHNPAAPWDRAPVAPGARSCELHVRWDGDAVQYPAILDPSWTSTASMSVARANAAFAVLTNNRVLVAGGNASAVHATAELYNPTTRTWAATGSLGTARTQISAVRLNSGRVLIAGGQGTSGSLASAQQYDPTTGTFSSAGTMATARVAPLATLISSGRVLLSGGGSTSSEIYTPPVFSGAGTWASTGSMLVAQTGQVAVGLSDNRVLVVGSSAPVAQIFNPSTGTWSSAAAMSVARTFGTLSLLADGRVLYAGGAGGPRVVEIFSPSSNTWTRTGNLTFARSSHKAVTLSNGHVLVTGGDFVQTAAEVFDPTWGTWAPLPSMSFPRFAHVAALMSNGRVLVAGGMQFFTPLASAEEFIADFLPTTVGEYKFAAAVDADVLSDRATEVWAAVHRPSTLASGVRYPVLLFLHGNHGTCGSGSNPRVDSSCQYTTNGTCPAGFSVVPNHRGYDYIASELASRGYIVVSINANRGITCGGGVSGDSGLNLARGRLVLKHLERLSSWNRGAATTPSSLGVNLTGKLDLTQVGLMGHSRGGEGVRAAYQQYGVSGSPWPARIVDPVTFRGIFEVGPVDGQTSLVLNAENTKWNVLLPMCDGDVSDLQGVKPFDRMLPANFGTETNASFKSTYTVWGANHNYYNTEWQQSDSSGCTDHTPLFTTGAGVTGSALQRQTGLLGMVSFFGANVGNSVTASFNNLFDPRVQNPGADPRVDRGHTPASNANYAFPLEEFSQPTGTSTWGQPNQHSGITISHGAVPNHDPGLRGATISWSGGTSSTFFQSNFVAVGSGFNLSSYSYLDLRVTRQFNTSLNPADTSFGVALVNADGSLSSLVNSSTYVSLVGPVGGPGGRHPILQTLRIPFSAFSSANLTAIRGVRLTFSITTSGQITVANIRAGRDVTGGSAALLAQAQLPAAQQPPPPASTSPSDAAARAAVAPQAALAPLRISSGTAVRNIRTTANGDSVQIELSSATPFEARGELLRLQIGDVVADLSEHPGGDLTRVIFTVQRSALRQAPSQAALKVRYGQLGSPVEWDFGSVDLASVK